MARGNERRVLPFLWIAIGVGLFPLAVCATGEDRLPPTPPFLNEPGIPSRIERVFSQVPKADLPKGEKAPKTWVERTITDIYPEFRKVFFHYTDRPKVGEYWIAKGVMIGQHPIYPEGILFDQGADTLGGTDLKPVFPEAKWVNESNFVTWETLNGDRLCRKHFAVVPRTMIPNDFGASTPNDNILSGPVTVWIDEETRLPVQCISQLGLTKFSYGTAPTPPPPLPLAIENAFKAVKYGPAGLMR